MTENAGICSMDDVGSRVVLNSMPRRVANRTSADDYRESKEQHEKLSLRSTRGYSYLMVGFLMQLLGMLGQIPLG